MSTEQLSMSIFASRADYDAAVLARQTADQVQRVADLDAKRDELRARLAEAFLSRCPAHLRGEHDVRDMQARPDVMAMGRAVEAAVLAANGLEVRRG